MKASRGVASERVFHYTALLAAGFALVGLASAVAWRAGQSRGGVQGLFALDQSRDHIGRGAALSPDGTTLVYVGEDDRLHAVNVGTGNKESVLKNPDSDLELFNAPAFSPDGRQIVFVGSHGYTAYYPFDIYRINPDGSGLKQLTHAIQPVPAERAKEESDAWYQQFGSPQFSPDGSKISLALFDPTRPEEQIGVMKADGSGLRVLGEGGPLFWGADSRSIYYGVGSDVKKLDVGNGASETIQGLLPGGIGGGTVQDLLPGPFGPGAQAPSILGKLPDKDWFVVVVPETGKAGLISVQHGAATFQTSLDIPLSKATAKGPVSLVSIQWTPSGRVLLTYQGEKVERFEVAQGTY